MFGVKTEQINYLTHCLNERDQALKKATDRIKLLEKENIKITKMNRLYDKGVVDMHTKKCELLEAENKFRKLETLIDEETIKDRGEQVTKLKKENDQLRKICNERREEIQLLEKRIEELGHLQPITLQTYFDPEDWVAETGCIIPVGDSMEAKIINEFENEARKIIEEWNGEWEAVDRMIKCGNNPNDCRNYMDKQSKGAFNAIKKLASNVLGIVYHE